MINSQLFSMHSIRKVYSKDFKYSFFFEASVILICCLSFILSWIESTVNLDSHHWGFMYAQALEIKRGLIPHKEALISYGYLTTWIQSISLDLFGERIKSIGIITGLFYSLNIFLSYKIFLKFLPKYISFLTTFLLFLLHSYIRLPWANYFSYTFQLFSILLLLSERISTKKVFISGFFLGLSILCRYSSVPALLPPILILTTYIFFAYKEYRKEIIKKIVFFSLGLLVPIVLFLGFLAYNGALGDFLIQNKAIFNSFSRTSGFSSYLERLVYFINKLIRCEAAKFRQSCRFFLFTINFFWSLSTVLYFANITLIKNRRISRREIYIISVCLVTLFGYLNSVHLYNIFRLVNGSSLGFVIIPFTLLKIPNRVKRKIKILILLPIVTIYFILAHTFPGTGSIESLRLDVFSGKVLATQELNIFQGKLLSKPYLNFYNEIYQEISKIESSYYVINYTRDPVLTLIRDFPTIQFSSFYLPKLENLYPRNLQMIEQAINSKNAVIFSTEDLQIPEYQVVFNKRCHKPCREHLYGKSKRLYISIPNLTM